MPAGGSGSPYSIGSVFRPDKVILDYRELAYNPHNDVIFPSIVRTEGIFAKPIAAYYMYYAPHDAPAGICMVHAPSIEGPWVERAGNPLIGHVWPPHYKVGHVSSPHAIWVAGESRLFLYFHGDNDRTHYAVSKDGIEFEYGGVAVDQSDYTDFLKEKYDRIFYARVFEHPMPPSGSRYVLLGTRSSNQGVGVQGIYLCGSKDARKWSPPVRVIAPEGGSRFVCSPCLFSLGGKHYVAYHCEFGGEGTEFSSYTDVYVDEFDADFTTRKPRGKLLDHRIFGETNPRVSDPLIVIEGETVNLVVAIETRLNQRFALAKADLRELERALEAAR